MTPETFTFEEAVAAQSNMDRAPVNSSTTTIVAGVVALIVGATAIGWARPWKALAAIAHWRIAMPSIAEPSWKAIAIAAVVCACVTAIVIAWIRTPEPQRFRFEKVVRNGHTSVWMIDERTGEAKYVKANGYVMPWDNDRELTEAEILEFARQHQGGT